MVTHRRQTCSCTYVTRPTSYTVDGVQITSFFVVLILHTLFYFTNLTLPTLLYFTLLYADLSIQPASYCADYENYSLIFTYGLFRLTPTLAVVILFSSTLFMRIAEEPIFEVRLSTAIAGQCKNYWWTDLLYINNLYPKDLSLGVSNIH